MKTHPKNNNLDYMIDSTFRNSNGLFVLSFKNGDNDPTINYFFKYYMLLLEIKDFNALIQNKSFFDQPVKNKQEAHEQLVEMSRKIEYKMGSLLDYLYHQNYYKLIGIDLSKQINTTIPQQILISQENQKKIKAQQCFLSLKTSRNYSELFFRFIKHKRIIHTMEHQKILNLLNESTHYKFVARKLNIFNYQSNPNYDVENEVIYNTKVL